MFEFRIIGSVIWNPFQVGFINKLEKVQRQNLRMIFIKLVLQENPLNLHKHPLKLENPSFKSKKVHKLMYE